MSISLGAFALSLALMPSVGESSEKLEVGMRPGQVHPDFELPSLGGELVKLSDFAGKKVVLIHFASW